MTNETQALLSAIETLCGKKKAKLLRRLAKAAMEADRASVNVLATPNTIDAITTAGTSWPPGHLTDGVYCT